MKFTKFGPKGQLSPTCGDPCDVCREPLAIGDYTTLVPRSANSRYADDAVEAHWSCAMRIGDGPRGTRA